MSDKLAHVLARKDSATLTAAYQPKGHRAEAQKPDGKTSHFTVSYDSALGANGLALANGVLQSCEGDYGQMSTWFGGITPGQLPFVVTIEPGSGGAYHFGCSDTTLHCEAFGGTNVDLVRMLMVAEAVEVFSASQGKGWDCGASNGEALSRVLATERYPDQLDGFASATSWINGARSNWIDQTEPSDRNYVSIGCGTLFLNFLRYQLGYSWEAIVSAGGSTLAACYKTLTGKTSAWSDFNEVIAARFPVGQTAFLDGDNPFIEDKWTRALYLDILKREPDPGGWGYWVGRRDRGMSTADVALGFIRSVEWCSATVAGFYQRFLNRQPDPGGAAFWAQRLEAGDSMQQIMLGFVDSLEFKETHAVPDAFVEALYETVLGRASDAGGKAYWVNALKTGASTTAVAQGFLASEEHAQRTVTIYYRDLLGREPDAGGLDYWTQRATHEAFQSVMVGFLTSSEYRRRALGR